MTLQMSYQEKYEQRIEQGNRQTALRMIEAGQLSQEEIALYSDLTLEQVLELEKQLQPVQADQKQREAVYDDKLTQINKKYKNVYKFYGFCDDNRVE